MRRFRAQVVAAEIVPDANTFVVVMGEHSDGSGARLELQRCLSFDEQDRHLGQDTYCISTETGAAHYGGVESWHLDGRVLRIVLNEHASEVLAVDGGFAIEVPGVDLAVVASSVERVVGGAASGPR